MKMYKIIPSSGEVRVLEYNGQYDGMKPHLKYDWFDHARMNQYGDRVFVSDTGLLDGTEEKDGAFWWLHDSGQVQKFVGDALYWGTCNENNADPFLSLEQVNARISWKCPSSKQAKQDEKDKIPRIIEFGSLEDLLNSMEY
jgi:hypothetical protein